MVHLSAMRRTSLVCIFNALLFSSTGIVLGVTTRSSKAGRSIESHQPAVASTTPLPSPPARRKYTMSPAAWQARREIAKTRTPRMKITKDAPPHRRPYMRSAKLLLRDKRWSKFCQTPEGKAQRKEAMQKARDAKKHKADQQILDVQTMAAATAAQTQPPQHNAVVSHPAVENLPGRPPSPTLDVNDYDLYDMYLASGPSPSSPS